MAASGEIPLYDDYLVCCGLVGGLLQALPCLIQESLHVTGGHNKVEYCSEPHLKESGFRSIHLALALAPSLGRGLRRIVARVRGVLGHLPHTAALWLAVASHCCSSYSCIMCVCSA